MDLIKLGKGAKGENLNVSRNIIVTDDISKINSLISVEENGEIINVDIDGNEVHTEKSFHDKFIVKREQLLNDLESVISEIAEEKIRVKLEESLKEMKDLPNTPKGQWQFRNLLKHLKDFASDLGAKAVAEIAMEQMGY